jgi:hypothetical protein
VEELHGGFVCLGIGHVADELGLLEEAWESLQAWDLEAEGGGFEAVGTGRVGGHGVGDHIAMKD